MTVERARVGDVLKLVRRPVSVDPLLDYEEIGIRSFGKGIFHKEPVSGASLGSKRVFEIHPNELVLSNVFAWEGAIAVSSEADRGKIGSHRFMTYQPVDGKIDIFWAGWFFRSEPGLELIRKASPGSAGRNRTLAVDRFEALEIPLPPMEQQLGDTRRMTRVQEAVHAVGALKTRSRELRAALSSGLVARQTSPSAEWREVALGAVLVESQEQFAVQPEESYRIVDVYSFGRGFIERGSIVGSETSYKRLTRLRADDLVVTKLNGWEGGVAVVSPSFEGAWVSGEYPTFHVDHEQLHPGFLAGVASASWFWEQLAAATRGSMVRRRRVSATDVLNTRIWIPGVSRQAEIAASISAVASISRSSEALESTFEALPASSLNTMVARLA